MIFIGLLLVVASVEAASLQERSPSSLSSRSALTNSFSPPVYPTPETRGSGGWAAAVAKGRAEIAKPGWGLEEFVILATGRGYGPPGLCAGNINAIPSVGFPGLCYADSPTGIALADFTTAFSSGINTASTFDRALIRARGLAMGSEFRQKDANVALGPSLGMSRSPRGGRNWEGFGADPYLNGIATFETVTGMQTAGQGCQVAVKHFIGNEQEHDRHTASSNIDDKTMMEIYMHPYLKAVQAEVSSVMCSYNKVNQSFACQNSKLNNGYLKTELGFQGPVISDWAAAQSGVASALSGLDQDMFGGVSWETIGDGRSYWGANLTATVNNGSVPPSRVEDMAVRVLASWFKAGQDQSYPATNSDSFIPNSASDLHINVQGDHYKNVRAVGAAWTVLLKNINSALPLSKPANMAVIGDDAFAPASLSEFTLHAGVDGTLAVGWGSGGNSFPYLIDPLQAIKAKVSGSGTYYIAEHRNNWDLEGAKNAARDKAVALVFINSDSGEEIATVDNNVGDRNNISAWLNGDNLVSAVASVNKNTIVVVHSVGQIDMEKWIDNSNVTAVVWAGLPGQESGNSLVGVLFGAVNPSGRLPYTIAKKSSDYPSDIVISDASVLNPQHDYDEGVFVDYRHFLAKSITPRYPFGFGLSYTTFSYSGLKITELVSSAADLAEQKSYVASKAGTLIGASLLPSLHHDNIQIQFTVKNTGKVAGNEIPQVYLQFPSSAQEPKVLIAPGASTCVTINLTLHDISYWNVVKQKWTRPTDGKITVIIGQNSFDTKLTGSF